MAFTLSFIASKGFCGGGGQIIIDSSWISVRSTTLCYDKQPQDYCYNESKACRDNFEKGLIDLLNKTCPVQSGDWWCDPDPTKDLAKLLAYVDQFKQNPVFLNTLKICNPAPAVCGDHILNGNDECDDGNTQDGDGCSQKCMIEAPSDVNAECYQNLHDGPCAQKKQACDLIQGDKNCPEQLNQCLLSALQSCKQTAVAPSAQQSNPPSPSASGCSLSPLDNGTNLAAPIVFILGMVPLVWRRLKNS